MAQINKPSLHFNTKLYTGNAGTQAITGVGFAPDLVWTKARNGTNSHLWYDKVRGVHKYIRSDQTGAEGTATNTLTSFDSDGFTVGDGDNGNASGANGVAWNWKAGGTASTNNDGSTACSLSANATSGFSISTHTVPSGNYTIGHGLGKKPKMVITKHTSTTGNFQTYFEGIGTENQQYLQLNTTAALANHSGLWGTGMTTSVVGLSNTALSAGTTAITYSFAEKKGYSKFGSFEGNENANGVFVYTGFKPAFVLAKNTAISDWWSMFDNKRLGFNSSDSPRLLFPNTNSAESTSKMLDFTSNGFKTRSSNTGINGNGNTVIYMAFAENPIVGTNNVAATAG